MVKSKGDGVGHYNLGIHVLFVCTGNICRSPMAEALFRARIGALGGPDTTSSTGLSFEGHAAADPAIEVMAERGIDLSAHRSRILTEEQVEAADLVIGMEGRHVKEAALLVPPAYARTFTFKELVRRARPLGPRGDRDLADHLAELAEGRSPSDALRSNHDDAVADPYGARRKVYRRCADELDGLVGELVELLATPPRTGSGAHLAPPPEPSGMV